jgi:LPXTG-motif cell wall-anchored protein
VKAASRPVVNASTGGLGAPVASTAEDLGSVALALLAILVPVLVLIGLVLLAFGGWWVIRRRRVRRRERRALEGVETGRLFG